jgi:hypothetical protein
MTLTLPPHVCFPLFLQFTYGDDGLNPAMMEDGDGTAGKVKSQKKKVGGGAHAREGRGGMFRL